jgi:hypothetical protein
MYSQATSSINIQVVCMSKLFLLWSPIMQLQVQLENCHPEREYDYGYSYCDTHQSQSFQDVVGESVPAQLSDHAQVSQAESLYVILQSNNFTKNKIHLHLSFLDNLNYN